MKLQLDPAKVLDAVKQRAPLALNGGWSEEVEADGHCHYFQLTGTPASTEGLQQAVSLCAKYEADVQPTELDDLDPLAPENCKQCRRLLLEAKKLI